MRLSKEMLIAKNELEKLGHIVTLPRYTEEYAEMETLDHIHRESAKNKINDDLIRDYYQKINEGDAIFVINNDLNGAKNYIGGNSFLEMAFAHVLNKKIFLLNPIPQIGYTDELIAMQPIIIDGDFLRIV